MVQSAKLPLAKPLVAEALGTALLLATVVGSGIMGEKLAGGNNALALLANSLATGGILFVLITTLGPISGAHFNPVVSIISLLRRDISLSKAAFYAVCQISGALCGVLLAHAMFEQPIVQISTQQRTGSGQWLSEFVATFALVISILGALAHRKEAVAAVVALVIIAAYWFTASTSFANPAVTIARGFTNTFSGIAPSNVFAFISAQFAGGLVAFMVSQWLFRRPHHG